MSALNARRDFGPLIFPSLVGWSSSSFGGIDVSRVGGIFHRRDLHEQGMVNNVICQKHHDLSY